MSKVLKSKSIVDGFEEGYILVSARKIADDGFFIRIQPVLSFLVPINFEYYVEWEPEAGPFSLVKRANELNDKTEKNYWFEYCYKHRPWAQGIVDSLEMKEAFIEGQYKYIFNALKQWGNEQVAWYSNKNKEDFE